MCASSNNAGCFPLVRANGPFGFYEHLSRWLTFFFIRIHTHFPPRANASRLCFQTGTTNLLALERVYFSRTSLIIFARTWRLWHEGLSWLSWLLSVLKNFSEKTMTHVGMKWHASSAKYCETHIFSTDTSSSDWMKSCAEPEIIKTHDATRIEHGVIHIPTTRPLLTPSALKMWTLQSKSFELIAFFPECVAKGFRL